MTVTAEQLAHLDPHTVRMVTRMDRYAVPTVAERAEDGFTAYARELAQTLCAALTGQTWVAEGRTPFWPSPLVEQRAQVAVIVDRHWFIVVTQTQPAGRDLNERWSITVNGRPIPHRTFPGEAPHQAAPIARSVWRFRKAVPTEACDALTCGAPATVATWRGSTCTAHVPDGC